MAPSRAPLRLPDFIIGGAPRSGTTWLYEVLDRHPDIEMAKPVRPEPKFFLVDDIYERGLTYYSDNWFSQIPSHKLGGEKSTNYLESEAAARRIHEDLPDARLIFILREPADRALSNWRWSSMNGLETLSFEEALRQEAQREVGYVAKERYSRPFSYFSRGLYRKMLEPYVSRFGLDRVLVLRYEDISREPAHLARSVHRFLNVTERGADAGAVGTINPSVAQDDVDDATISGLRQRYAKPNRDLVQLLGPGFEIWE